MASRAELLEKLAAIRRAYAEKLPAKVQECRGQFAAVREAWQETGAREIRSEIHRLAGSGGTFGFKVVTTTARAIEQLLDQAIDGAREPLAAEWDELARLFDALARAAQQQDGEGPRLPEKRSSAGWRKPEKAD